ncbi:MAG: DNA-formamidopyrimidine glycosylase family protein [Bacteroidota bacterium]
MPELPEVHGYQTYINSTCLNQKIIRLDCRDNRLLKQPKADFEEHLIGNKLIKTERIGKYLFVHTSGEKVLLMHFGMTGRPNYFKSEEDRPKFGHIMISFENGFHFAFENKRKFGYWDLVDSVSEFQKERNLSDDARNLTFEQFKCSIQNRKTDIKKVIMDQSVTAGIGNWMADDILYQAKIHPQKKVQDMSDKDIQAVFDKMKHVIEVAIEHEAHYESFPTYFFIHIREENANCHHTNSKIERIKVGGRTTFFSPKWQKI